MQNINNNLVDMARIHLLELKTLCNKAIADNAIVFVFRGHEVMTEYAKYLISFAERDVQGE